MIHAIPIRVECRAEYRGDETPRALEYEQTLHQVVEILDRWYQASVDPTRGSADYYRVRTSTGRLCVIKLDHGLHAWFLVSETS